MEPAGWLNGARHRAYKLSQAAWGRAREGGHCVGENIAMGQRTPREVVDGWMNSPGHRANILSSSFAEIGVRNTEFAQIVSGIIAGDPVISSGGYALPDNTQIKIEAAAPAEKDAGDKSAKSDKSGNASKLDTKDKD